MCAIREIAALASSPGRSQFFSDAQRKTGISLINWERPGDEAQLRMLVSSDHWPARTVKDRV